MVDSSSSGTTRAVLDAIALDGADLLPRGEGEHEGLAGDAVGRHRPPGASSRAELRDELVETGQGGVVHDHLDGPVPDTVGQIGGDRRRAADDELAGQRAVASRGQQRGQLLDGVDGRHVGDARDAVSDETATDGGEVDGRRLDAVAQPGVGARDATGRRTARVAARRPAARRRRRGRRRGPPS